jgi:hypothetical protein
LSIFTFFLNNKKKGENKGNHGYVIFQEEEENEEEIKPVIRNENVPHGLDRIIHSYLFTLYMHGHFFDLFLFLLCLSH